MKNYEITEEQIKELAKGNAKVKKMFPEVFENKLEVGKWYKIKTNWEYLIFIEEIKNNNTIKGYGFNYDSSFNSSCEWCDTKNIKLSILATDSEVLEALTNEAKKRGFVKGAYFKEFWTKGIYKVNEINYQNSSRDLRTNGYCLFHDGKWAEIVKTYTKEEAEKLLNAKIVC